MSGGGSSVKHYVKSLLLMFSAVLVVGLIGCSSSGAGEGNADSKSDEGAVELTLLTHYSQQQEEELQTYIDQWNEENPNIHVTHKSIADFSQLLPTMMAQQTAGQQADILHVYSLWGGQLVQSNVLAAPPEDVIADIRANYPDAAVNGATVNGELYGYPTEIQTYALYYNKKLLEKAGYSDPPETWDELYEIAEATTEREGKKLKVAGFGLKSSPDSSGTTHPFLSLLYSAGGTFISEDGTETSIHSDAALKTLRFQQQLIEDGLTDTSFEVADAFPSEQVAMTINAGWWQGTLKATMGDKYAHVGVTPVPSPDGSGSGSVSYGFFYGVNERSQQQKEAWEFLKWLNAEAQENGATPEANFLASQGIIPSRTSDLEALETAFATPNNQPFIEALEYAVPEPNVLNGEKIKTSLQKQIESVWSGQITPEQALETAEQQILRDLTANQ